MNASVQQILDAFDALPELEKHEAAIEILRRVPPTVGDLPESTLVEVAEDLFLALDADEAKNGRS